MMNFDDQNDQENLNKPVVSVCIVTFNHQEYIIDCLMSILAQRIDVDIEILVGDDCSTDHTGDIVLRLVDMYPSVIRYFRHSPGFGAASLNYKYLISKAKGQYIAHVDGDDYWLPGKLKRQVAFLRSNPSCVAVYCNAICIDENLEVIGFFNNSLKKYFNIADLVRYGNFLNNSTLLYRSEFAVNILKIPDMFLDYQVHLVLSRNGSLGYLNSVLSVYRASSSGSVLVKENTVVRDYYWRALLSVSDDLRGQKVWCQGVAEFLRSVFFRSVRVAQPRLFKYWLIKIFKESGCSLLPIFIYFCFSLVITVFIELKHQAAALFTKNSFRILYYRRGK